MEEAKQFGTYISLKKFKEAQEEMELSLCSHQKKRAWAEMSQGSAQAEQVGTEVYSPDKSPQDVILQSLDGLVEGLTSRVKALELVAARQYNMNRKLIKELELFRTWADEHIEEHQSRSSKDKKLYEELTRSQSIDNKIKIADTFIDEGGPSHGPSSHAGLSVFSVQISTD